MIDERRMIIAIDGPAGSGKSSIAKLLANELGYTYIDTGAMYRAVAWVSFTKGISWHDMPGVEEISSKINITFSGSAANQSTIVDGRDISAKIREEGISEGASIVSGYKKVRESMTAIQRFMGKGGGVIMEGRDIGTVVFPDADIKFFIYASLKVRARRRFVELKERGGKPDYSTVFKDIKLRDARDRNRDIAPLKSAKGAIKLDTSDLSFDEILKFMLTCIV